MTFPEYISRNSIGQADVAKALNISQSYASRLMTGDRKNASPQLALRIEAWTDGAVPAVTLSPIIAAVAQAQAAA